MSAFAASNWIAPYHRPNPAATVRLFCFPYAGGGASVFARWMTSLPSEIEVCPIQPPGRENRIREPFLTSVREMAEVAAESLDPYFERPFAFFGHSLGALVAYELAQKLRATRGLQPQHLIVSAHRAPRFPFPHEQTWHLPEPEFIKRLEELNGTPKEVLQYEELLALMLPMLRADFRLDETYTQSANDEPLDCPITVFGGSRDTETEEASLRAWNEVTRGEFRLKMFDADHFFIHSHAPMLMQEVSRVLTGH